MAENIQEHDRPLTAFKRRYRKAQGRRAHQTRRRRANRGAGAPGGAEKRLDIMRLVAGRIPRLSAAVQKQLERL